MKRLILGIMLSAAITSPAFAARNLVLNGSFRKGTKEAGDDAWTIPGWHVRLADWRQSEVKRDEDGKRYYTYSCGCGHKLGDFHPWAGLRCPACKGFFGGEECGSWYIQNHKRVSLGRGKTGKGMHFKLSRSVGNNQGVRVYSRLIKAKPGWGYKLSFDAVTKGSHARVFVECFRETTQADYELDREMDPSGTKYPVERCFRAHVNCTGTSNWKHFTKTFVPRKRYRFDWMSVKLYAYMPGEAAFDNVVLRPLSPAEMDDYLSSRRKPKDKRFEY